MVFKSILVALCKKEQSSPIIQQAIWLAKRERARMLGLHVVDQEELVPPAGTEGTAPESWRETVELELRALGQGLLERFATECAEAGVPAETRLLLGPVAHTICRQAHIADWIVMGRTGEYAQRTAALRCCPLEGVLRQTCRPVLIAAPQPRPIERVLVAYDGSERACTALAVAARLASEWQVSLLLLTVVERQIGRDTLAEAQAYLEPYGVPEKALLREGTPAVEILRASREERADLIAMGAYCHNPIQELVFGGTVGQVVRRSDSPVLICR